VQLGADLEGETLKGTPLGPLIYLLSWK